MDKTITRHCQACQDYQEVVITKAGDFYCPHCSTLWGHLEDPEAPIRQCPICFCRQFYLSKDFDAFLGCFVVLIGIILVPWTYGLSLPVVAAVDWFLFKRIKNVVNCYKCGAEFQGFRFPDGLKPFQHHIGVKYDKS